MQPTLMSDTQREFSDAVLSGLRKSQKSIPSQYFYDARGSELFEEITELDAYYPTRTEIEILNENIPEFVSRLPANTNLIEFGSGSSTKTEILLTAIENLASYIAIDVSETALVDAKTRLSKRYPELNIVTLIGSFFDSLKLPENLADAPKLGFFPGSTIGNFAPDDATALLRSFRRTLAPEGQLIVGVDLQKNTDTLINAYDDAKGVTADFNLNLLTRINRELEGTFDLNQFSHSAIYNERAGRIEMHLVSQADHSVDVLEQTFSFESGETIHTENSHKYTAAGFASLAAAAGWHTRETWTDANNLFSVHVLGS